MMIKQKNVWELVGRWAANAGRAFLGGAYCRPGTAHSRPVFLEPNGRGWADGHPRVPDAPYLFRRRTLRGRWACSLIRVKVSQCANTVLVQGSKEGLCLDGVTFTVVLFPLLNPYTWIMNRP